MKVEKYSKIPVVIEATQWDGTDKNAVEILNWIQYNGGKAFYICTDNDECNKYHEEASIHHAIRIETLEGYTDLTANNWAIRGVENEFYACKNSVFLATYNKFVGDTLN